MQAYWLTFTDGTKACCEGQGPRDAKIIAEKLTGKTVAGGVYDHIEAQTLPYPASPRVWGFEHPVVGQTPTFCWRPNECAGKGSCPQSRSCTE